MAHIRPVSGDRQHVALSWSKQVKVSTVRLLGRRGQSGQGLAEYALILALISIAAIVAVTFMGTSINTVLSDLGNAL